MSYPPKERHFLDDQEHIFPLSELTLIILWERKILKSGPEIRSENKWSENNKT